MRKYRPTIILNRLIGGWGNQAFQVCAVSALNEGRFLTHHKQSKSGGYVESPAYFSGEITSPLIRRRVTVGQFDYREFSGPLPVIVDGMFMNFGYLQGMSATDFHHQLLNSPEPVDRDIARQPLCMLGFRSFSEESRHEWRLELGYYEKALKRLEPGFRFLCFGDDAQFVEWNLRRLGILGVSDIVSSEPGQRDLDHIEGQIRLASECHAYIISNSSFHIWCALMSHTPRPRVMFPSGHWLDSLGVPQHWEAIADDSE